MPNAVFHRVAAGALALSDSPKFGTAIERSFAYVVFDKELVMLQRLPELSSILVRLHSNGKSGGATVVDHLRVLLSEALTEYRTLRCIILAPLPDASNVWVDLDALAVLPATAPPVSTQGRTIEVGALKEALSLWLTQQCEFSFILAEKLRRASATFFPKMLRLQDMPSDWVVRRSISFEQACLGAYTKEYVAVSHRWENSKVPDTTGAQLEALRGFVLKQKEIQYIFYDLMSLPQGDDRTPAEKAAFAQQLPNINLLYIGCSVLIMLDRSYFSRFWTLYEAWLSFMQATREGLLSAPEAKLRCHLVCIHGTPHAMTLALKEEWLGCSSHSAFQKLSSPDVVVTNMSDKEMQLPKILSMNQLVVDLMAKRATSTETSRPSSAAGSGVAAARNAAGGAAGGGTPNFLDKVKIIKEALEIAVTAPKQVIAEANEQMGLPAEGALPQQADTLLSELGL